MDTIAEKYPKTPHLSFSRTIFDDDIVGVDSYRFLSPTVGAVITEKMDGENTTFYCDKYHARSIDSRFHPSRSVVARLHGEISWMIPPHRRIILENVYAEHSIKYDKLSTFAYGIAVIDRLDKEGNGDINGESHFLSWDDSIKIFDHYGITPVPTLKIGPTTLKEIETIFNGQDHSRHEGLVVRSLDSFPLNDFSKNAAKAVRRGHVQTDEHWTRRWKPNSLA